MTKKELIAAAGGMPILKITDFILDQFKAVGMAEKIGENGQDWEAYKVGSIVCVNGPRCPLTEAISERVYIPGKYEDDNRTPEEIIQKTGLAIKVKSGFKTWGWLAEKVIESELTGKPFKAIFRPYNQYRGKWASRSYYKIPEGLDDVCKRLGLVYELKNDAPRGGKAGDYLEFMRKKYYIAYDYVDEFGGEVLAVTTNKLHALEACRRRKDETGGECYTNVETAESKEEALKIARAAEKKGYAPILEVER